MFSSASRWGRPRRVKQFEARRRLDSSLTSEKNLSRVFSVFVVDAVDMTTKNNNKQKENEEEYKVRKYREAKHPNYNYHIAVTNKYFYYYLLLLRPFILKHALGCLERFVLTFSEQPNRHLLCPDNRFLRLRLHPTRLSVLQWRLILRCGYN